MVLPVLTGVPVLLGDQLSPGSIWVWSTVAQDQLHVFVFVLFNLSSTDEEEGGLSRVAWSAVLHFSVGDIIPFFIIAE